MSRRSFQSPPSCFQMTMYLPRSSVFPALSSSEYSPTSVAVLPPPYNSTVFTSTPATPAAMALCQNFWIA